MKRQITYIFIFSLLALLSPTSGKAQKTYQWRGEERKGTYHESNLLQEWPEKGPTLLWSFEKIGAGFAAPVITENQLFVNGETDSISFLYAFDLKGKLLWKSPNGKEFFGNGYSANFPGARSCPTIVNDLVYTISGHGRLACFETSTGKERWAVEMIKNLGGLENEFGYAESPVIDGDVIFCVPGGPSTNVAALNRLTGKTIWTSKAIKDTTSFCSPALINLPSGKILVTLSHHYIYGIDTKNGELMWSQKLENFKYEGDHCNTPIYSDGFIYFTTEDENGDGVVKLQLSPDGKKVTKVWRNSQIGNGFGGIVKLDKFLFMTTGKKQLVAIDIKTGAVTDALGSNKGSLIYADNRFYCYNDNGDLKLIKFENNKFGLISKFKVTKGSREHFSHPVIANGVLYLRHGTAVMAFGIKKP